MKKLSALFMAVLMLITILPVIPMTAFAAADTTFVNATFESDDTTTWTTVNTATISKVSGGADGSGNALKTNIQKGSMSSIKDYGAASFAFTPAQGSVYTLSADIKLNTCASTVPSSVSFVVKNTSGTETVVRATTDKTMAKGTWIHCEASYTAGAAIATLEVRVGSGKIAEIGEKKTSMVIFTSYTFEFLLDNLKAMPEAERADYLAMDFEDGWYPNYGEVKNGEVTWSGTDTLKNSKGAIRFSTKENYGRVLFPLRTAVGNKYEISVWVKPDKTPASQNASFVIYSPSEDGSVADAWNEITAHHTENLEAGKWTLCTATFEPDGKAIHMPAGEKVTVDVTEESVLEFRMGSGVPSDVMEGEIAYMMDDLFVFPEVDNKGNSKELVTGGGLTTEAIYKSNWTYSSGSTKVTWMSEGANGTAGAANIEVTGDWGTLRSSAPFLMEFGRTYTLTFWAKATSEEAVDLDMYAYLSYANHKTLEETPKWVITKPSQDPRTLTTEWQKYSIDFVPSSLTTEKIYPYLYFRAGEGTEKVKYAVDEISIVQKGDSNFGVGASAAKTAKGDQIVLQLSFIQSTSKHFMYKMIGETENGEEIIKTVKTTEAYEFIDEAEYENLQNIRFEVIGVDAFNLCSRKSVCYLQKHVPVDDIKISPDQYIWTNDVKTLSATVNYKNETEDCEIVTYAAQYNADNKLVFVSEEAKPVYAGTEETWQVTAPADPTAVKVKYFTWVQGNQKPVMAPAEMTKTTSGEFIYVDINSTAASANGSFDAPYKSLNAARNRLRNRLSVSTEKDIYVIFKGGEYVPGSYATMDITERDYAEDKNVIYTSFDINRAKITGAKHLTDFKIYDAEKNIYRASVPAGTQTRQLYVNGIKATRARSPEDAVPFVNLDQGEAKDEFLNLGLTSTDTSFINYQYPNELEIYFTQNWRHQFVMVDEITETEDGLAHFGFTDNVSNWSGIARCNTPAQLPVFVENAYELLDEPGEWYLDTHQNYVYYIPRSFENMETADVVIPGMEKLLNISGTPESPAKNMTFKNIDFEYTTWNYPTTKRAFVNGQNATYARSDNGGQLMDAAVELYNAHNITFDNCDFSRIGSMALKMTGAIQHCNVIGNEFYELAGGGVNLGEVNSNNGIPVRYPTEEKHFITDNVIANNYIHKIGTEYRSAAAIGAGFPKNTVIRNNDLSDGPYSGMHTGWGWGSTAPSGTENFVIEKNYIHDFMNWRLYDGGGIYTLGNTGGTKENPNYLRGNYFVDIANHYGAIYPDEGSTGWMIADNVCDVHNYPTHYGTEDGTASAIWLHIWTTSITNIWFGKNYSTTGAYKENGKDIDYIAPEVYADAQWPDEAKQIIEEAGIEKEYQNRFDFGLQTIRIPRLIETTVGGQKPLVYNGITSKDAWVDLTQYEITMKSSNPAVATATTETVTGHSKGTAWITFKIVKLAEDGSAEHYDEHTFRVVVN